MNFLSAIWRCLIMLLTFSIQRCPLRPAGCQVFNPLGYLTVKPDATFLLGSNLTVYCHITNNPGRKEWLKISLELNGTTVHWRKKITSTTMMFNLPHVWTPKSIVICKLEGDGDHWSKIVNGLDLHGGLPPDKPGNITCETSRSSDFMGCSWTRGQETYLSTSYNISIKRENGTLIRTDQIWDAESITVPRSMLDENATYLLNITAYNHFGVSQSDPFVFSVKDMVIPETPHITHIEFENSTAAVLQWNTIESLLHLRAYVRLCTDNITWEVRTGRQLSKGLYVDNLRPLTEYEFQVKTCNSAWGLTLSNTSRYTTRSPSRERSRCSKWSLSVRKTSPGKGPSQQLHVWRMLGSQGTNGRPVVTVLWKPPPPEDYSGVVQQYKIFLDNGQKHVVTCGAAFREFQVEAEVQALSVSAVTSYGISPPADVTLRQSGVLGPALERLTPTASGSAVLISWSWPKNKDQLTFDNSQLLYYVIEWTSVPASGLHWLKLAKDLKNTSISGLTAGVRYNMSLYAVTTRGVSAPSSSLVYSREQMTISAVGQRQMWLDCPEGPLALQLTASTAAGEGPRGRRICSQLEAPSVSSSLVIGTVFIITVFIGIIANLMCWSCVRKRIKQKCISWGPAWLVGTLPKPGHSNAIKLLKRGGDEPLFSFTDSDPPLSPIVVISQEDMDEVYPTIHVDVLQNGPGQLTANTPLLFPDGAATIVGNQMEHVSYKPQIFTLTSQGEEVNDAEDVQWDDLETEEEDRCSVVFKGLLGDLLPSVDVEFSDKPQGLSLCSVTHLLQPKRAERNVLNKGFSQERKETEGGVDKADFPAVDLQQEDVTPDTTDMCLSPCLFETTLNGGYFPQVAAASSDTLR
ncbi:interleukin-23 receptor isoform X2 [Mugil cephalus]|uniref:interleukin-23 receptor isoform X2 n=1 Tax=Mugil cephalus TaxID=48193 RepID=UPI001FB6A8F3|nr:interleukin-23 receptor isoform X2 [Mugil cephalus]